MNGRANLQMQMTKLFFMSYMYTNIVAEVGNILSWRWIMKYFLRSFSPFRWFKKGSCQFLAKEYAQYWLTA